VLLSRTVAKLCYALQCRRQCSRRGHCFGISRLWGSLGLGLPVIGSYVHNWPPRLHAQR